MCETTENSAEALATVPREAPGDGVDPIALEPVDEIVVTTLVDNVFDGLLMSSEGVRRPGFGAGIVFGVVRGGPARGNSSTRLFQAPHDSQRPAHFG